MLFRDVPDIVIDDPWPGRIVGADVSALISIGGAGKGLTMADVAARVSQGWPMPPTHPDDPTIDWDAVATPGYVIMISLEDHPSSVRRRLAAAGANLDMVDDLSHVERKVAGAVRSRRFSINDDLGRLADRVQELGDVRLVVIDPLFSAARTTVAFNQQLRTNIIEPLQEQAATLGVAILLVHHFTKGVQSRRANSANALSDYVGGSQGLIDALRMLTVVTEDPNNAQVKVMQNLKANEGAKEVSDRYIIVASGPKDPNAHIEWEVPPPAWDDEVGQEQLQRRLLEELIAAEGPVTPQRMVALTRLSYYLVNGGLRELERAGRIERRRGAYSPVPAIAGPKRRRS